MGPRKISDEARRRAHHVAAPNEDAYFEEAEDNDSYQVGGWRGHLRNRRQKGHGRRRRHKGFRRHRSRRRRKRRGRRQRGHGKVGDWFRKHKKRLVDYTKKGVKFALPHAINLATASGSAGRKRVARNFGRAVLNKGLAALR